MWEDLSHFDNGFVWPLTNLHNLTTLISIETNDVSIADKSKKCCKSIPQSQLTTPSITQIERMNHTFVVVKSNFLYCILWSKGNLLCNRVFRTSNLPGTLNLVLFMIIMMFDHLFVIFMFLPRVVACGY